MRRGIVVLAFAYIAHAQTFEVASVKVASSGRSSMTGGVGTSDPGRWSVTNIDLFNLLANAYDLKANQLVAPPWATGTRVDIVANLPKGTTRAQF
ncbi:MAG: hypothetical protein JWP63_2299, partial [Candidatus Solibacter sp.]|nr:hypothetical protein [Candidatus Solibacter sp.]